jgi:3-mercaptopyruvate sulfurtransferase SseA
VIVSCLKGLNACVGIALWNYIGLGNIRLYSGSFSEWKANKE